MHGIRPLEEAIIRLSDDVCLRNDSVSDEALRKMRSMVVSGDLTLDDVVSNFVFASVGLLNQNLTRNFRTLIDKAKKERIFMIDSSKRVASGYFDNETKKRSIRSGIFHSRYLGIISGEPEFYLPETADKEGSVCIPFFSVVRSEGYFESGTWRFCEDGIFGGDDLFVLAFDFHDLIDSGDSALALPGSRRVRFYSGIEVDAFFSKNTARQENYSQALVLLNQKSKKFLCDEQQSLAEQEKRRIFDRLILVSESLYRLSESVANPNPGFNLEEARASTVPSEISRLGESLNLALSLGLHRRRNSVKGRTYSYRTVQTIARAYDALTGGAEFLD